MPLHEKVVIITKPTPLDEMVRRHATKGQARFLHRGRERAFNEAEREHSAYQSALDRLLSSLPSGVRHQTVPREYLPTFTFGDEDLVITVGPDGLVVNTAKYLDGQPLLAFNPDPATIDGVLVPFRVPQAPEVIERAVEGALRRCAVTMAKVELSDGQTLHALNDFFIGQRTHVSARYHLKHGLTEENQISSGIIVSTGAGSTGWYRSLLSGAAGVAESVAQDTSVRVLREDYRFEWEAQELRFCVREPFVSRVSSADLVHGVISHGEHLEVFSQMPQTGVIFSDGVLEDALEFTSGTLARVGVSNRRLNLIVGAMDQPDREHSVRRR